MIGARIKAHRDRRRKRHAAGTSPGTLVADPQAPRPKLHAICYGPDGLDERDLASAAEARALLGTRAVLWLNVDGLGDAAVLERLGHDFGLHRLALEDTLNVGQRPKLDRYADHFFLVARMPDVREGVLGTEQLAVFCGGNFVITFQERAGDCFDPVRRRLREGAGRMRSAGPDYLVYALVDRTVDDYFPAAESCSDRLDTLETEVLAKAGPDTVARLHQVRRDLLLVRRALWPLREVVASLARDTDKLVADETRLYLRDCYDHVVELMDLVENYRDIAAGLMEVYLSVVSNRMNEIMKVLTIISTIFIPLTFISSIYGMNFERGAGPFAMPELGWAWGYPFVMGLMLVTAIALLVYFRRRGWLGGADDLR
jgi:magnesium transporter